MSDHRNIFVIIIAADRAGIGHCSQSVTGRRRSLDTSVIGVLTRRIYSFIIRCTTNRASVLHCAINTASGSKCYDAFVPGMSQSVDHFRINRTANRASVSHLAGSCAGRCDSFGSFVPGMLTVIRGRDNARYINRVTKCAVTDSVTRSRACRCINDIVYDQNMSSRIDGRIVIMVIVRINCIANRAFVISITTRNAGRSYYDGLIIMTGSQNIFVLFLTANRTCVVHHTVRRAGRSESFHSCAPRMVCHRNILASAQNSLTN